MNFLISQIEEVQMDHLARLRQVVLMIVFLIIVTTSLTESIKDYNKSSSDEKLEPSLTFREHFKLPRLFDFEYFKNLFKRHYDSYAEEMVRQKLYLGRAFRAFVSIINYKYKKFSHYLAINHMSDWTQNEVRQVYIEHREFGDSEPKTLDRTRELGENLKVDLKDIWSKLEEIGWHKSEADYLINELNSINGGTGSRKISINNLIREPTGAVEREPGELVAESNGWFKSGDTKEYRGNGALSLLYSLVTSARDNFFNSQTEGEKRSLLPDLIFIDHRNSSCYQAPRSQGKCGSCYAFATIALYEWLFCQETGQVVQFSEQYVVDCGVRLEMNGCKGAKFTEVSKFVQEFGLDIRGNYPYVGRENECPFKLEDPINAMGYMRVQDEGFKSVPLVFIGSYLNQDPFVMNIRVNQDFSEYGGGVDRMDFWQDYNVVHSVLVVGSGREDGDTYWLIRNSLSENWGENGHYKLNKKTTCINPEFGFVLIANFKPTFEENLNKDYDRSRIIKALIEHPTIWDRIEGRISNIWPYSTVI